MPRVKKIVIRSVKGMSDILPEAQPYWDLVLKKARTLLDDYSFKRIDTPIVEKSELFVRSVGEVTDIVEKEMYTFRTKGGDRLALRPEFTAGIARAYIENGMQVQPHPVQLWTHGPLFRHENPQAGRSRQHHQINIEMFGDETPSADAQVIFIACKILESLGIKNIIVKINSIGDANCRPLYIKALKDYFRGRDKKLCAQCQKRLKTNPLRLLDCKNEGCKEIGKDVPQFVDYLDDECKKHFKEVLEFLDELEVPYLLDHTLVRGLDYYTRTTFEIAMESAVVDKDATENEDKENIKGEPLALCGGGRYDRLVEILAGPKTAATGFGMGIERVILALGILGIRPPESRTKPKVFVAQLGEIAKRKGLALFEEFRKSGIHVKASFGRNSIKSQLRIANRLGIKYTVIIGQKEALDDAVIIRSMNTGEQETIPMEKVIETIKTKLRR